MYINVASFDIKLVFISVQKYFLSPNNMDDSQRIWAFGQVYIPAQHWGFMAVFFFPVFWNQQEITIKKINLALCPSVTSGKEM